MRSTYLKAVFLSVISLFIFIISFSQKQLYVPTTDNGIVPEQFDSTTIGPKMNIKIDQNLLRSNSDKSILLLLPFAGKPQGVPVVAKQTRKDVKSNEVAWYGYLENQPKSFVLITQVKDVISGHIRTNDNKIYRIDFLGNNVHEIRSIEQRFFKPDRVQLDEDFDHVRNELLKREALSCCDSLVIDILVVYTSQAKRAAGGSTGIASRISQAINHTNISFRNSNIPVQIELAHSEMVNYNETGSLEDDRNALQDSTDGKMDNVHAMRNRYHADIVVLLVKNANLSGIGNIMTTIEPAFESKAFCVVQMDAALSNLSLAHEIGHIMGSNHECNATTDRTIFPYSHGYSIDTSRTIMSTNLSNTRVEYWSDPNIKFAGTNFPTGSMVGSCQANDAECLRRTFALIAKFRCKEKCTYIGALTASTTEPTIEPPVEQTVTPDVTIDTRRSTVAPNPPKPEPHSYKWLIIIGAIAIALVVIFWFIWGRRKKSEDNKDKL